MAVANRSVIINVTPEQFYSVVADFEAYPEFCNDVEAIEVLSRDGDSARVLFTIRVVKSIQYTLNLVGRPHSELKWTLHSSKWFKHNNGGWDIKDLGDGRIEASYGVDVGVGVFVPKAITRRIVELTFPAMLNQFKKRAEQLFPK
ncbi:MAG: SRPBCC family protein [Myxococcota bacterium]|nr:SRPBCC family protein [Myxococcota bacterium]